MKTYKSRIARRVNPARRVGGGGGDETTIASAETHPPFRPGAPAGVRRRSVT
jgi:hypothetical protein